ncbi:hypothetical protein [Streptomyces monomycini]|uniref:hypothetical protein n=1 Tax=Streptomyces monomycini TaxID=371720 RepID=UPI0004AB4DC0|nr:hypothetical protein [Streptomyces monomycini]
MSDSRNLAAQYVIMTLLIAAVIGLIVMNVAQAADKGLWNSARYGCGAFVVMVPLAGWAFEKCGLLRSGN